jgi:formiminotetrahydrofolate cyclodeaminase
MATMHDATPTVAEWLEQLAAKRPAPGGGAVAALSAALSAALAGMVSIYTTGDKWANSAHMQAVHETAARLRVQAVELMAADALAFGAVGTAYALPRDTADDKLARTSAIQQALVGAAEPPRQVVAVIAELLPLLTELAQDGNPNVISDVAVAASLARAALEAAIVNIDINRKLINDAAAAQSLGADTQAAMGLIGQAAALTHEVQERLRS